MATLDAPTAGREWVALRPRLEEQVRQQQQQQQEQVAETLERAEVGADVSSPR